jgi:hypothetical protein
MNAGLRELAQREQDGLQITLLWDACSNKVSLEVVDQRDESSFLVPVAGHCALDAFHHPYAYALATDSASEIASAQVPS